MSNLSSGNSCDEGTEELANETTSNVLSCKTSCNDGSSDIHQEQALPNKKIRKLPGNPDPTAEVIALSPKTLMATNRFVCEVCNKGFQREQNLQLHRRGHNLPWKLKQKTSTEIKKRVYICPEPTCIHHNPARALGDLTGIKKHYSRKHGEKKWKCDKCSKKYAVQSDWKAHSKSCGSKEYKCDCGTIFSRRDSFVTHRAFCDALTEENNKVNQGLASNTGPGTGNSTQVPELMSNILNLPETRNSNMKMPQIPPRPLNMDRSMFGTSSPNMSATALLQQAAQMGSTVSSSMINSPIIVQKGYSSLFNGMLVPSQSDHDQTQTGNPVHGFVGSILHNGTQETFSELLNSNRGDNEKNSRMQDEGWCINGLFNEENQRLLNNEGCDNHLTKVNGESANESLTLDFLGIGGMRQRNFHEIQQQQQEMSFEQQKAIQQSNQGLSPMWDV